MSMIETRRRGLAAASLGAAIVLLAGCVGDDAEPAGTPESNGQVRVTLDWLPDASYAGVYVGVAEGHYADAGIDVEVIGGGPNAPVAEQQIAAGNTEIAFTSNVFRLFSSISQGQDLVIIGTQFQESPAGFLSLAAHPLESTDDLNGARVLAGEHSRPIIDTTMKMIDVPDYEFVPSAGGVNPLIEGEGDALWAFETSQPVTLEREFDMVRDEDYFFVTAAELGTPSYANLIIADREWAESNRESVVAFLKGSILGWQRQLEEPDLGADLTVNDFGAAQGLELDVVKEQLALLGPYLESEMTAEHGLLWVDRDKVSGPIYDALQASGQKDLPDVDDVVDTSYLEQALEELG